MSDSPIRLIDAGTVSSIRSQTIYHALGYAQTAKTPDTIVFARPDTPYMCIGFFQDANQELNLDFCKKNKLPIIRREQGGGAVYVDNNQLFIQWIFQQKSLPLNVGQRFRLFVEPLIETHKQIGIDAYFHPINDVHVDGKKIVGTGAAGIGNAEIVTGNFLFDFDFETMISALKVPNDGFKADFSESLRQYLTTINKELANPPSDDEIKALYVDCCERTLNRKLIAGKFTERELEIMEALDQKMLTDEWLYQFEKPMVNNRMVKVHAGVFIGNSSFFINKEEVNMRLRMKDGMIDSISIDGKPLWLAEIKLEVEKALTGLKLEKEILKKGIGSLFNGKASGVEKKLELLLSEIIEIKNRKPAS